MPRPTRFQSRVRDDHFELRIILPRMALKHVEGSKEVDIRGEESQPVWEAFVSSYIESNPRFGRELLAALMPLSAGETGTPEERYAAGYSEGWNKCQDQLKHAYELFEDMAQRNRKLGELADGKRGELIDLSNRLYEERNTLAAELAAVTRLLEERTGLGAGLAVREREATPENNRTIPYVMYAIAQSQDPKSPLPQEARMAFSMLVAAMRQLSLGFESGWSLAAERDDANVALEQKVQECWKLLARTDDLLGYPDAANVTEAISLITTVRKELELANGVAAPEDQPPFTDDEIDDRIESLLAMWRWRFARERQPRTREGLLAHEVLCCRAKLKELLATEGEKL